MSYPTGAAPLIVAAAPEDQRAALLAEALRSGGWQVVLAVTPEAAARAAGLTCIAVLTPAMWNHPAIVAAVTSRPARLIPVLEDQMALPQGPWTSAPYMLGPDTAQQILAALGPVPGAAPSMAPSSPPPVAPYPGAPYPGAPAYSTPGAAGQQPSPLYSAPGPYPFAVPPAQPAKKRSAFGNPATWIALVAIVAVIAVGIGIALHAGSSSGANGGLSYSASIPSCGSSSGDWQTLDATTTCQPNTVLVTRSSDNESIGEVAYDAGGVGFPHSYEIKATGTIVNGDNQASLGIVVHRQRAGGGQLFEVTANGLWDVFRTVSADSGSTGSVLGIGTAPKSSTYTLDIKVLGPQLTLSINGKQVGATTDATYTSTDLVVLAVEDPGASGTVAASFSNFSIKQISDSPVSDSGLVATATAQTRGYFAKPYSATVPGQSCDTGGASWADPSVFGDPVTAKCTSSGLQLSQNPGDERIHEENFYFHNGSFPANYSVQIKIAVNQLSDGCAVVSTRESLDGAGYAFSICQGGQWNIDYFDDSGTDTPLGSGNVTAASSYTILATSNGSKQSLKIDGTQVAAPTESSLKSTNSIGLGIAVPDGQSGSATFSDFVFTTIA